MRLLRRGNQLVTITPEIREFLKEPKLLIMTKAAVRSRVHRRVHLDYIGVKRFDAGRQSDRRMRVVRVAHIDRLHALGARHSLSAAQGRPRHQPRRLRSVEPFRQGAGQRAGALSARRSVPDRRRHALSVRAGDPAARRAAARARAAAARSLRPLCLDPGLHSARPLRLHDQGEDRRLISPRSSTGACAPSTRSFPKARWCACISSSGATRAKRRTSIAPCSIAPSRRSCGAGPTDLRTRCWRRIPVAKGAPCSRVIAMPSRSTIAKSIRRPWRSAILPWSRRSRPSIRSASSFTAMPAPLPPAPG